MPQRSEKDRDRGIKRQRDKEMETETDRDRETDSDREPWAEPQQQTQVSALTQRPHAPVFLDHDVSRRLRDVS